MQDACNCNYNCKLRIDRWSCAEKECWSFAKGERWVQNSQHLSCRCGLLDLFCLSFFDIGVTKMLRVEATSEDKSLAINYIPFPFTFSARCK
jgi:hypothetical protein